MFSRSSVDKIPVIDMNLCYNGKLNASDAWAASFQEKKAPSAKKTDFIIFDFFLFFFIVATKLRLEKWLHFSIFGKYLFW